MEHSTWSSNILFDGLNQNHKNQVSKVISELNFKPHEIIMEEGESGDFLYLIAAGDVLIQKGELILAECLAGDMVGLMSLIDEQPRSATVISGAKGVKGFKISKEGWSQLMEVEQGKISSTLLMNYVKYQQDAVRNTNDLSLQEAKARLEHEQKRVMSAQFFVQMVLGLVVFTFLLGYLSEKAKEMDSTYVSFGVMLVYGIWSLFYVRMSGLPFASFGLTMKNFKPSLLYCMKGTVLFLAALFLFKWYLVSFQPEKYGDSIIQLYSTEKSGFGGLLLILVLYVLHAVIQEFIARGCIQGGLLQFITGKRAGWTAILLATLMFSSFHVMIDIRFAVLTIIPGLFWGYLFYKKRNILAVSLSHIVIGVVALFVLNMAG